MRPSFFRSSSPLPAPLASAVRLALRPHAATTGFGFVELLAVAAAGALLATAAVVVYQRADTTRMIVAEQANVTAVSENTQRVYAGRNEYADLTNASALNQGIFPAGMVPARDGFSTVPNAWGGSVSVSGTMIDGGIPGNGFIIAYSNVPPSACAVFVAAAGQGFSEVTVRRGSFATHDPHQGSVLDASTRKVDPGLAAQRCADGPNTVSFIHAEFPRVRARCGDSGPIAPETQALTASCPETGTGNALPQLVADPGPDQYHHTWSQTHTHDGSCGPSGNIVWGPWSPPTPTHACADQCEAASSTTTNSRIFSCSGTDLIETPGPALYQPSAPQTSTTTTSQTCATPIGPSASQPPVSTQWSPAYSCAPECVAPPTSSSTTTRACPAGQIDSLPPYTTNGITDTTTRTWACPLPIGSATYSDSTTTQNRCAPACVIPSPSAETRCTSPVQSTPCPSGQTVGAHTYRMAESRAATCGAPTGAFAWSPWSQTGARCDESNTCAPPPPPACPPVSTACPPADRNGYTVNGPYTNASGRFCTETKACPAGYNGTNTSYRTDYTAATPSTCASWSPWNVYTPGSGCTAVPPACTWPSAPTATPACPAPYASTPQTGQWIHGATCPDWIWQQTGSCPSPPSCSWPNPPSATPACSGGGSEQGGTWIHGATCPAWVYSGGSCYRYSWTETYNAPFPGAGGNGGEIRHVCSWNGWSDWGAWDSSFDPGTCSASNVGQSYYCSDLQSGNMADLNDYTYTCLKISY